MSATLKDLSLRAQIRRVVDAAERRLAQPEILAALPRAAISKGTFSVTIAQMLSDRQLSRRKATKAIRAFNPYVQFVYGPGREPVEEILYARRPRRMVGFMELARQKDARRRAA